MLILLALGLMSITWMAVVTGVVLAQKLLPARAAIDLPIALAIVGLGLLIIIAPASIPVLTPRCDRTHDPQLTTHEGEKQ